ncbi:MAG: transcriptional repressor [Bdellovibrionota bacterium]
MKTICIQPHQIEEILVKAGVQPTLQRIALCRYVLCEANHPTADDVKAWAQDNLDKVSQATVYNTLGKLVEVGLLKSFRFPHSEKIVYDQNVQEHYHFLDEITGKLVDIDTEEVDVSVTLPRKYKVNGMDVIFKGIIKERA